MTRYRNRLPIAAILLAGASVFAPTGAASAQGALQTRARVIAPPPAPPPAPAAESAALQPARSVLHQLVGRWRFAIWFAGNFDGPPDATGTRVAGTLYDDLRLEWTETHDDSSHSQGVLGFDPRAGRFYSSAVYSDGSGVQLLSGTPSPAEPLITFTPLTPAATADRRLTESFTLTVIDPDHFTWVPLDRGWRAVFTREP
jgi:hypothetical protein